MALGLAFWIIMLLWLVRLRFAKAIRKLTLRVPPAPPASRLELEA